jgi:flagellar assembly factor FliW
MNQRLKVLEGNQMNNYREEDVIRFENGLAGYEDCRRFILVESENLAPLFILQNLERPEVAFLVVDSKAVVSDYNQAIPAEAWSAAGVTAGTPRLSLVVLALGATPQDSTVNLRAPLIVNYENMTGLHVTLTDSRLSVTHPILGRQADDSAALTAINGN